MGQALQTVTGFVTNPGATITALTASTGDSFAVRSFDAPARAGILNLWTGNATGGVARIRSPRLHDPNQGLRLQVPAGNGLEYLPRQLIMPVYSVDQLIVESSGGGAEVDILSFLIWYSDIGGINANLVSWPQIADRIVSYCGVELTLTSGATAGQYGGSRTLNQDFQNLKADQTYALIGYTCKSAFATVVLNGPDTGNLNVGGPGSTNTDVTADWFSRLSSYTGLPLIPVIKANNQGATTIALASTDTATAHPVSLILAQLSS